jgi:hypothetical protein
MDGDRTTGILDGTGHGPTLEHRRCHQPGAPFHSTQAITDGNPDYLAWIAQETGPEQVQERERVIE